MKRISTFARALAIIGMLVHAGWIVWHNVAALGTVLQHQALAVALAEICHGAGSATHQVDGESPTLPTDPVDQSACPICKGAVSAVALLPVIELPGHMPDADAARMEVVGRAITLRLHEVRPPTCGPPSAA